MKIGIVQNALNAAIIEGKNKLDNSFEFVYASDLMSDVLAFGKSNSILLTGLASRQAVISAHMAEFQGVVFIRGKRPKDDSEKIARENNMFILLTDLDMYEACLRIGLIMDGDFKAVDVIASENAVNELSLNREFHIEGHDFSNAGMVSTEIKSILKKIGFDPKMIRRVAISTYEGEMNVVMHAEKADVSLSVTPHAIEVIIDDTGKGIANVKRAMEEGFSTATEEMRAMGFGSGMGLPNINRNADKLDIESVVDRGTKLKMIFYVE